MDQKNRKQLLRQDSRHLRKQKASLPRLPEKAHDERRAIEKS